MGAEKKKIIEPEKQKRDVNKEIDNLEESGLKGSESGSSSGLKINQLPLAKPGEDLYVRR